MRFFLFLILSLNLSQTLLGQQTEKDKEPEWVNSNSEEEKYYSCCFYHKEKTNVTRDNFNEKINEIKSTLTLEIAKKIQTSVKSTNLSETRQIDANKKSEFMSNFSSKNSITTNVRTIGNTYKFEYWPKEYSKENKTLSAFIKISRKDLEETYEALVRNEVAALKAELEQNLEFNSENLKEISENLNSSISILGNDLSILTNIQLGSDFSKYQEEYIEIKRKYNLLLNKMIGRDFENNYRKANLFLQDKECEKAYDILHRLSIINPNDDRVMNDKSTAIHCLETGMISRISSFENKREFENALFVIDSLSWISPSYLKIMEEKKSKLINDYFDQKFRLIDNVIETNISEAEKIHNSILFFGSEKYKSNYNKYKDMIEKKKKNLLRLKFENEIDKKNFKEASRTLVQISEENSGNKDISKEIRKLNQRLENSIYSFEKKELQWDRPHLYCFKFGINLISSAMPLSYVADTPNYVNKTLNKGFDIATPFYTFEIYRKFINSVNYNKNHRDKSTAHMLGLRFGLAHNSNRIIFKKPADSLSNLSVQKDFGEIQLSGILFNFFHISSGILSSINSNANQTQMIYSSNLGIKMRVWRFDLNANIRYNSDYNTFNNFYFEGGLSFNINFHKKFNSEDQREVLVRVGRWKDLDTESNEKRKRYY